MLHVFDFQQLRDWCIVKKQDVLYWNESTSKYVKIQFSTFACDTLTLDEILEERQGQRLIWMRFS